MKHTTIWAVRIVIFSALVAGCGSSTSDSNDETQQQSSAEASKTGAQSDANPVEQDMDYEKGLGINNLSLLSVSGKFGCIAKNQKISCWGQHIGVRDSIFGPVSEYELEPKLVATASKNIKQLTTGRNHLCALLETGEIECGGRNYFGQLGLGHSKRPPDGESGSGSGSKLVKVPGVEKAVLIESEGGSTCAILDSGEVECWGQRWFNKADKTAPRFKVKGLTDIVDLDFFRDKVCGVTGKGAVWCWKSSKTSEDIEPEKSEKFKRIAQLNGDCAITNEGRVSCLVGKTHKLIEGLKNVVSIATSREFGCARNDAGKVFCWGSNQFGQLGAGALAKSSPYKAVPVHSVLAKATSLATGGDFSCAQSSDEKVYCWGLGESDQMGVRLPKMFTKENNVELSYEADAVFVTEDSTCIRDQNGFKCWGAIGLHPDSNIYHGANPRKVNIPKGGKLIDMAGFKGNILLYEGGLLRQYDIKLAKLTHKLLHTFENVVEIGSYFSGNCLRLSNGTLRCWDYPEMEEMYPDEHLDLRPPLASKNLTNIAKLSSSNEMGMCGIHNDGYALCWGTHFVLFDPSPDDAIPFGEPIKLPYSGKIRGLAVNDMDACVLSPLKRVKCWGMNFSNIEEFGGGKLIDIPVRSVERLVASSKGFCALDSNRTVRCWYSESPYDAAQFDEYGNERPLEIDVQTVFYDAVDLKASLTHFCARSSSGSVQCWGENNNGQLGFVPRSVVPIPTEVYPTVFVDPDIENVREKLKNLSSPVGWEQPQTNEKTVALDPDAPPVVGSNLLRSVPSTLTVSSVYKGMVTQIGRLFDGDMETAWNSATGDLENSWISFEVPESARVESIEIVVGYVKQTKRLDLFTANYRVKKVRVLHNGSSIGEYELDIENRELQPIKVAKAGGTYRVEFIELEKGSRPDFREVCISELRVVGTSPSAAADSHTPTVKIGSTE